jgi:DNA-directed RNA polymerase omega subunit
MNDFEKAVDMVGNRFDLVLIASERVRELNRLRREQGYRKISTNKEDTIPVFQAITDIETGLVGREYLTRINERHARKKKKFDNI